MVATLNFRSVMEPAFLTRTDDDGVRPPEAPSHDPAPKRAHRIEVDYVAVGILASNTARADLIVCAGCVRACVGVLVLIC